MSRLILLGALCVAIAASVQALDEDVPAGSPLWKTLSRGSQSEALNEEGHLNGRPMADVLHEQLPWSGNPGFSPTVFAGMVAKDLWNNLAPDTLRKVAESKVLKYSALSARDALLGGLSPGQRVLLEAMPLVASASLASAPQWLDDTFALRDTATMAAKKVEAAADSTRRRARVARDTFKSSIGNLADFWRIVDSAVESTGDSDTGSGSSGQQGGKKGGVWTERIWIIIQRVTVVITNAFTKIQGLFEK